MAAAFQGFRSFTNTADAISVIDKHGNFVYGSASTAKVLGYQSSPQFGALLNSRQ
jgi:PAS domain S-box-containing protein